MNTCKECGAVKLWDDFPKNNRMKTGYLNTCKDCKRLYSREYDKGYYLNNKDKKKKFADRWYANNADRKAETQKKWREDNHERVTLTTSEWRKDNPYRVRSYSAKYRAAKLQASPPWLTSEQELEMQRMYESCKYVEDPSGEVWEVDHIVPLQGENVCGLHVPWNLQLLPRSLNRSKANKFEETV